MWRRANGPFPGASEAFPAGNVLKRGGNASRERGMRVESANAWGGRLIFSDRHIRQSSTARPSKESKCERFAVTRMRSLTLAIAAI